MVSEHVWTVFFALYGSSTPILARLQKDLYSSPSVGNHSPRQKEVGIEKRSVGDIIKQRKSEASSNDLV